MQWPGARPLPTGSPPPQSSRNQGLGVHGSSDRRAGCGPGGQLGSVLEGSGQPGGSGPQRWGAGAWLGRRPGCSSPLCSPFQPVCQLLDWVRSPPRVPRAVATASSRPSAASKPQDPRLTNIRSQTLGVKEEKHFPGYSQESALG